MTNHQLHLLCENWVKWCQTRKFFALGPTKNVLAKMQPAKVREPPNAILSADLSRFNSAIGTLIELGTPGAECFVKFYCERVKNIKSQAAKLGIHRDTFYDRKTRFARKAWLLALTLEHAQNKQANLTDFED